MTCRLIAGQREWKMSRDEQGHRTYTIEHLVEHDTTDGPFNIINCPGLPVEGQEWDFDGDHDPWAFCMPTATVERHEYKEGHPRRTSKVTQTFTTKAPDSTKQRCSEIKVEDPLLEPPKVTWSYSKYQEEATEDRFGRPIVSSSHEQMRGPQNEWDANRIVIKIEQNVATPAQAYVLPNAMKDTLNDAPLWGLDRRCIKMTPGNGERKFYGRCNVYYTRVLEFEVRPDGFDRDLLDEGSKLLHGHWDSTTGAWILDNINGQPPNPANPTHFNRATDKNGNPMRVVLDGEGKPAESTVGTSYASIVIDNVGNDVQDLNFWVPLNLLTTSATDTPPDWEAFVGYEIGNVVTYNGEKWISIVPAEAINVNFVPGENPDIWVLLPFGLTNLGAYSAVTTYTIGDFVAGDKTLAGTIHVEKYLESNFLLLGIPTSF